MYVIKLFRTTTLRWLERSILYKYKYPSNRMHEPLARVVGSSTHYMKRCLRVSFHVPFHVWTFYIYSELKFMVIPFGHKYLYIKMGSDRALLLGFPVLIETNIDNDRDAYISTWVPFLGRFWCACTSPFLSSHMKFIYLHVGCNVTLTRLVTLHYCTTTTTKFLGGFLTKWTWQKQKKQCLHDTQSRKSYIRNLCQLLCVKFRFLPSVYIFLTDTAVWNIFSLT